MRRGNFTFVQTLEVVAFGTFMTMIFVTLDVGSNGHFDRDESVTERPEPTLAMMAVPRP